MASVVVPALVAGIGLLGGLGLTALAAALRIGDRSVPRWLVPVLTGAFGLGASILVVNWSWSGDVSELVVIGVVSGVPAAFLARAGRFDLAGLYLVAFGGPSLVWWAFDVLGGSRDAAAIDVAVPAASVAAGLGALVLGNRPVAAPARVPPDEPDPSRAVSIATAMMRELRFGPADLPNVVAIGTGVLAGALLATALAAIGVPGWLPTIIGTAVAAVIGTELFYHVWPRRLARAMAAHAFLGSWEAKRFVATTGSRVPISPEAARRWLEQHPETEENRWVRPELHAWAGNLDAAYDVLGRIRPGSDVEGFDRRSLEVYLDTIAGREADVDGLAAAAEAVGEAGSDERMRAVTAAAMAEARRRLATGEGDWIEPLVRAQERIGPRALGIQRSDTWRSRFVAIGVSFTAVLAVIWLVGRAWT